MAITATHSDSLRLLAPLGRRTGRPQRPADLAWFEECGAPVRARVQLKDQWLQLTVGGPHIEHVGGEKQRIPRG